ncbi:hypothetical protein [Agrococcus versicolor]|uniref:hypothetical protein n=1 Tax=Agrococcus versicolor TaxID=501482 RepID=UPI0031DBEF65
MTDDEGVQPPPVPDASPRTPTDADGVQPPPVPTASPRSPREGDGPVGPRSRPPAPSAAARARRLGAAARRHAPWAAVAVLAAIAVLVLLVGRFAPAAATQSADSVAAWDADMAAHRGAIAALTNDGSRGVTATAVDESGLSIDDMLQPLDGVDLQPVVWACGDADAAVRLSTAAEGLAVPVLGPGDPESEDYARALSESDQLERELAAAATYADDVAALGGSLAAACDLAGELARPLSDLEVRGAAVAEGELAQVGETTTVVCAGAYGCPAGPGPSPTYEWAALADTHREVAAAFAAVCPTELEASCALAVPALEALASDDEAVLTAWAAANDADSTTEQLQALQTALDDRADRFEAAWAEAEAAAPGGDLEGALAGMLADGLGALGALIDGVQLDAV